MLVELLRRARRARRHRRRWRCCCAEHEGVPIAASTIAILGSWGVESAQRLIGPDRSTASCARTICCNGSACAGSRRTAANYYDWRTIPDVLEPGEELTASTSSSAASAARCAVSCRRRTCRCARRSTGPTSASSRCGARQQKRRRARFEKRRQGATDGGEGDASPAEATNDEQRQTARRRARDDALPSPDAMQVEIVTDRGGWNAFVKSQADRQHHTDL